MGYGKPINYKFFLHKLKWHGQFDCFVYQGENPIYKQATSTFKNPTYGGKQ